ncbi:MAG: glutamate ABC transporter substrate-binding protein [Acidimicrobiia bacterium]|jgi:glutamate transport system substrate-binding protein
MRRSLRRALLLFVSLALVIAACGGDDDDDTSAAEVEETPEFAEGTTMARLAEEGSIRIGTKFDQPGLGNINLETNAPEGFDVEIGKIVAGKLGIGEDDIEWIETISANREAFIAGDRVDIVIATYTINDERKEQVDFAGPYYVAGQDLLVGADDDSINGPDDLAGKRVCAASGSTPIQRIRESYPEAEPVEFDTYTECVDQLEAAQIDAVSTDDIILAGFAADPKYEGLFRVVGETFSEEPYGIGLPLGDDDLRTFLNDTLEESFEDGTWAEAFEATLGASGAETPEPPAVDRY